jgi:hypothetical protein
VSPRAGEGRHRRAEVGPLPREGRGWRPAEVAGWAAVPAERSEAAWPLPTASPHPAAGSMTVRAHRPAEVEGSPAPAAAWAQAVVAVVWPQEAAESAPVAAEESAAHPVGWPRPPAAGCRTCCLPGLFRARVERPDGRTLALRGWTNAGPSPARQLDVRKRDRLARDHRPRLARACGRGRRRDRCDRAGPRGALAPRCGPRRERGSDPRR